MQEFVADCHFSDNMITVKGHSQEKSKNATNDAEKTNNRRESNYRVQCHIYLKYIEEKDEIIEIYETDQQELKSSKDEIIKEI